MKMKSLKLAHEFVSKVKHSVIAGGAARDMLTGRKFKDIDIFIPACGSSDLVGEVAIVVDFCHKHNLDFESIVGKYGSEVSSMGDNKVLGVIKTKNIDFIFMTSYRSTQDLIDGFDMVSSQAWLELDGDGFKPQATELFYQLDEKKILGIYPDKANDRYEHIKRICDKYSDYLPLNLNEARTKAMEEQITSEPPF